MDAARELSKTFEPYHAIAYYCPEVAAFTDAGFRGWWQVAGRRSLAAARLKGRDSRPAARSRRLTSCRCWRRRRSTAKSRRLP